MKYSKVDLFKDQLDSLKENHKDKLNNLRKTISKGLNHQTITGTSHRKVLQSYNNELHNLVEDTNQRIKNDIV